MTEVCSAGFPHSDISGSMDICSSPKLFAAYHVFHRLLVPRHPPCALLRLTNFLCHVASRQLVWVFIKFITFKSKLSKFTTSCDYLSVISSDVFLLIFKKKLYFLYAVFKVHVLRLLLQPSGDGEIRTLDPLLARQVLSQLSYTPTDAVPSSIVFLTFCFLFLRWARVGFRQWA